MDKYLGNKLAIFIFAFPGLALFIVFVVYPLFPELMISLQNHDGFTSQGFVGLSNYVEVLKSSEFWNADKNNLLLVLISTLIGLPISLFLAILLDTQSEGMKRFFKGSSFLPAVLSVTVIAQMWIAIYDPQWGLVNTILDKIGLGSLARAWLGEEKTAIWAIGVAFIWQFIGFNMLLFYTGIKSIPKSYYEAAVIDGAGPVTAAVKITLPLLREITKFLLLISILGCMAQFAHVKIMTSGGPGDASRTIVYQLYYTAFNISEFGKGCATSILYVVECLGLTVLINSFIAKERIEF